MLALHPAVARDFQAFLAAARRPGAAFAFGTCGIGTLNHLGAEQFVRLAGFAATHVPCNGTAQAHGDLFGGRLQFMFANLPEMIQAAQNGQVRAVALSNDRRARELPEVATMAELVVRSRRLLPVRRVNRLAKSKVYGVCQKVPVVWHTPLAGCGNSPSGAQRRAREDRAVSPLDFFGRAGGDYRTNVALVVADNRISAAC